MAVPARDGAGLDVVGGRRPLRTANVPPERAGGGRDHDVSLVIRAGTAETPGMAPTSTPVTRVLTVGGLLLVVPAALAVGWGIGQLPTRERHPEAVATPPAPPASLVSSSGRAQPNVVDDTRHAAAAMSGPDPGGPAPAPPPQSSEPAARSEFSQWTTFENAITESQRNGKPVMIDFNADWCPPCRRMKEEVFQNGAHASAVQTLVIPVSVVDRSREDGRNPGEIEDLQRRYQVDAFPTLIVFSPASGRVMRTKGYGDAQATVAWIVEAARSVR